MLAQLFGGKAAEKVLLFLHSYEEGHVQIIAETMDLCPSDVWKQVSKFEDLGLIISLRVGRTRVFPWKPGNPFVRHLRALLEERLKRRIRLRSTNGFDQGGGHEDWVSHCDDYPNNKSLSALRVRA